MTTSVGFAASLLLKPALVVAGSLLLAALMRQRGPAARHAMWTGAILALLALPLLSTVLPPLRVEIETGAISRLFEPSAPTTHGARPTQSAAASESLEAGPWLEPNPSRDTLFVNATAHVGDALLFIWAMVALVLAARRITAEVVARGIVARGQRQPMRLAVRCDAAARARGLQHVRFVVSDETASPAVTGLFRPVVVLPNTVDGWTDAQLDAVLVHELSHVSRHDCLINLLADLAASMYWCNPLVYHATSRVRAEGELACDEDVVRAGGDPDAYALMLLDFARATLATRMLPRVLTAAARPSELESRVIALLDVRHAGVPLRRWTAVALTAVVPTVAFPVASATVHAEAPAFVQAETTGTTREASDSLSAGSSERLPLAVDRAILAAAVRRALSGPDSGLATLLVGALDHSAEHENDLIRERAEWALSQTRGNRLLEPVVEALNDRDWRTQAYAAWTVAVARDHESIPDLIPLMQHPVWRVRAMAAAGLHRIGAPEAAESMIAALGDPAWQVRLEAVEYLGALDAQAHADQLRAHVNDDHIAVRRAAARVLNLH